MERRLEGHEHDDEIYRLASVLDVFRIVLASQFIHMTANTLDMVLQIALLILWRFCIHIFLISHKRHFRVDNRILPLRIVQNHVGLHLLTRLVILQRAPHFVAQTGLHLIVSTFREPLTGQQVAKNNLAHIAAHLVIAPQYVRQALRLLTQLLRLLHHLQHLFAERGRVGCTLFLILTDSLLHVGDSILQRLGNACHRLRVRLFQFRSTGLHQLLGHILKLVLAMPCLVVHLLAHQFQFPHLRL